MLARSLKKIWTDQKLVYLCSAKDKMVSNLTTILLCFVIKCPLTSCSSQFAVNTVAAIVGSSPQVFHINLSLLQLVSILQGATGVGSNLEIWSCPAGYRPSYFVREGGKGVGRSIRESQAPLLCRSTPRALAKVWWSVRAKSCLPDLSMLKQTPNSAFSAHMLQVFLTA